MKLAIFALLAMTFDSNDLVGLLFLISLLSAYFLPTLMALIRNHHQKLGIFFLNLFLGWTLAGWIIPLVWSGTATREVQPV
jgi:hypothetical protein